METARESGRIFARNLPYTATEEDISELFSSSGPQCQWIETRGNITVRSLKHCIIMIFFVVNIHLSKSVNTVEEAESESDEPEEGSTLFVKNLNFDTIDEELHDHFKSCGKIQSATVAD